MRPDRYDVFHLVPLGILLLIAAYFGGTEAELRAGAGMFVGVLLGVAHVTWRRRQRARR